MLILSRTIQEAHMSWDTVNCLLQNLGFIINIKISILYPCQKIEFLGMETDLIKMTLSLAPEKVQKVVKTCQNLLRSHSTTLLELARVIGLLSSTIQAMEPPKIQFRFFQQQQIMCLRGKMNYHSVITLNTKSRSKLAWCIENLTFRNYGTFSQLNPPTNDFSKRCFPGKVGNSLQRSSKIRAIVIERQNLPHKCARNMSNKIGPIFLHQRENSKNYTLWDRQQGSLILSFENGGTKNEHIIKLSKKTWHYLLNPNNVDHGRIPSFSIEYSSRHGIKKKKQTPQSGFLIPKFFMLFLGY